MFSAYRYEGRDQGMLYVSYLVRSKATIVHLLRSASGWPVVGQWSASGRPV